MTVTIAMKIQYLTYLKKMLSQTTRPSDEVLQSAPQYYELDEDGSIPVISKSGLRICHLNVNSIPNKIDEIKYML